MSTQAIRSSAPTNDKGSIVIPFASGSATAGVSNVLGRSINASPTIVRPTPKDGTDTNKILSGGNFAHDGGQIISNVTTTVAGGVSETAFRHVGPSEASLKPIANLETGTFRQVPKAIRDGLWAEYSGKFSAAPTVAQENYLTDLTLKDVAGIPSGGYGVSNGAANTIIGGRTPATLVLGKRTQ